MTICLAFQAHLCYHSRMVCQFPKINLFSRSIYEKVIDKFSEVEQHLLDSVELKVSEFGDGIFIYPKVLDEIFGNTLLSRMEIVNAVLRMFVVEVTEGHTEKKKSVLHSIKNYPGLSDSEKSKLISYIMKESV